MEKLKLNCSLFIAIFLLLAIFRLTVQQEIDVGNLFLQAEERKFKNRNLSTTITSVADCVTCVANNANKYCRDITSSVATGYCCTSAETGTNCGSSTNSKCTSDTSNFPTGTGYFLCPQAMSNSFCGASFDTALTIQDGIDTIINAYYIKSGEMCDYTVKVLDSSGNKFTVTVLQATNLNVLMAKKLSSSSYSSATTLTVGTSYSQQALYGESYSFLAKTSGGSGTLVILIQSQKTGSTATTTSNTPIIAGIAAGIGYFIVPWTLMFIIMFLLWIKKLIFPKRLSQQSRRDEINRNQFSGPPNMNRNINNMQGGMYLTTQQNPMNQRAHSNASSQGFRNQYIVDSPISVSNPNSQIQVQHRSLYPPPAPISSVSNGMESNPYITSPYMPVVQRNQMT